MTVSFRKSKIIDDWYVIEGINTDACIEGTAEEMLQIAKAIENRGRESFRRCAVNVNGNDAILYSPRNSEYPGTCSLIEADDLVKQIRLLLTDGE